MLIPSFKFRIIRRLRESSGIAIPVFLIFLPRAEQENQPEL